MIEYATLRVIWWVLMGVILIGFAIMDGFDLGVAGLLPIVARKDIERRIAINTVGPVWEGNQVWFILGGGVFFAAWPYLYAITFSGFYFAILLALVTLILRPAGFKYRSKLENSSWRSTWDWILCFSGIVAPLTFGVAIGNVLQGVPFYYDSSLRAFYTGTFFGLFNPFAILCGLTSVAMILMQGGAYLVIKTKNDIRRRAIVSNRTAAIITILLFAIGGLWIAFSIKGYVITQAVDMNAFSNPVSKAIATQVGVWQANFLEHPYFWVGPILGFLGPFGVLIFSHTAPKFTMVCSSLGIFGIISTVGLSMFPFILPSSSNPGSSLLVWDASASQLSLSIMFISTCIFLPIVLIYTAWVYHVLRGKVTAQHIEKDKGSAY